MSCSDERHNGIRIACNLGLVPAVTRPCPPAVDTTPAAVCTPSPLMRRSCTLQRSCTRRRSRRSSWPARLGVAPNMEATMEASLEGNGRWSDHFFTRPPSIMTSSIGWPAGPSSPVERQLADVHEGRAFGADRSATSTSRSARHPAANGTPARSRGTRPVASASSVWNGWGCVTGTIGDVAAKTAAPSSSSPVTGTQSHCPPGRTVAGPSLHSTGGAPSSSPRSASSNGSTRSRCT